MSNIRDGFTEIFGFDFLLLRHGYLLALSEEEQVLDYSKFASISIGPGVLNE
jgi:hypothetical protein